MRKLFRNIGVFILLLVSGGLVAACGGGNNNDNTDGAETQTYTVTVFKGDEGIKINKGNGFESVDIYGVTDRTATRCTEGAERVFEITYMPANLI